MADQIKLLESQNAHSVAFSCGALAEARAASARFEAPEQGPGERALSGEEALLPSVAGLQCHLLTAL